MCNAYGSKVILTFILAKNR